MKFINYIKSIISTNMGYNMWDSSRIKVRNIISGPYCVSADDGRSLKERIQEKLAAGEDVTVDFKSTSIFASPFFRAAFGDIIREMGNKNEFFDRVSFKNIQPSAKDLIRRIVNNIQKTTDDPAYTEKLNKILTEELAEI